MMRMPWKGREKIGRGGIRTPGPRSGLLFSRQTHSAALPLFQKVRTYIYFIWICQEVNYFFRCLKLRLKYQINLKNCHNNSCTTHLIKKKECPSWVLKQKIIILKT